MFSQLERGKYKMSANQIKKSRKNLIAPTILIILVLILIFYGIYNLFSGSSSTYSGGEFRCTYCSKVIYYDYRPIHCTNLFNDTYKCDYCGHKNVIQ